MANYTLRDFIGGAPVTTLASDITSGSTSISMTSGTGFPTGGGNGDFFIGIGSLQSNGTFSNLEVIRMASRSTNTLTVQTSGRASDNTIAVAHTAGETIFHSMTALDAREANYVVTQTVGLIAAKGDLLSGSAANTNVKTTVGANNTILVADSAQSGNIKWAKIVAANITAATITTTEIAANTIVAGNIASGTITTTEIADGTIAAADLASNAVTTVKITDANVTLAKLDAPANKGITQIVTTVAAYVGTPTEGARAYETTNHRVMVYAGATDTWQPGDWNMPWGILGYKELAADTSTYTASTDIITMTAVTAVANRRWVLHAVHYYGSSVAGDEGNTTLQEGGTVLAGANVGTTFKNNNGTSIYSQALTVKIDPTAASHTYKLTAVRQVGTGNLTSAGTAAASRTFMYLEDLGSNGAPA